MKIPSLIRIAGLMAAFGLTLLSSPARATTLFSDDFQTNLSKWGTNLSGVIVADPLVSGGHALAFTHPRGAGDLFSASSYSSSTGTFILSYDYLGIGGGGGYVGIRNPGETWLAGDGSFATPFHNTDNGTWVHVSFTFSSASAVQLELEQWDGKNATPQQAFFKNLVLTDGNGPSPTAPEPGTLLLLGLGALLAAKSRRTA